MNYLDLAIVVIILLGTLAGIARGLTKTLKKSFIIVVVLSAMLCGVVGNLVMESSLGVQLSDLLTAKLTELGGDVLTSKLLYVESEGAYYMLVNGKLTTLGEALGSLPPPVAMVINMLLPKVLNGASGFSVLDKLVPFLTRAICMVGTFVVLAIIIKIILVIINMLLQSLFNKVKMLGWVDKTLGGVWALIKSALFVLVGMSIVSFVAGLDIGGLEPLIQQIDSSVIGKWLIENNVLNQIISAAFNA